MFVTQTLKTFNYLPSSEVIPVRIKCLKSYLQNGYQRQTSRQLTSRRHLSSSPPPPFITTPIYYVNGPPHIGHLYTSLIADAYRRYLTLKCAHPGLIFSSGTDEHGMKIDKAAKAGGLTPIRHCDEVSAAFQKMTTDFSVDVTDFVRTTEGRHVRAVGHFWVSK